MRTPEQILNLRKVICLIIGPYGNYLSDEQVNTWADGIQKKIDDIECHWAIRVRTFEDEDKEFTEIIREEKTPYGSVQLLKKSCQNLLDRYKTIQGIMICPIDLETGIESLSDVYLIGRDL